MRILKAPLFLFLLLASSVQGQIGNQFWFAAPDISSQHYNNSIPLKIHVTAIYATTVTVSRPADPGFTPYTFNLAGGQTEEVRLDGNPLVNNLNVQDVETYARDAADPNFIQDKGFLITSSPGEVSVYYEPEGQNNSDYAALKAHNALGKDFWVSTQRRYKNHDSYSTAWSGFTIVAAEDCDVTINPNGNNLAFHGTGTFTVSLKKGEAFAVRAAGQDADEHIHGVHVTSTGDIAIMIYDDSIEFTQNRDGWDLFLDQTVPVELIGLEYIAIRGETQDSTATMPKRGEAVFVTPTENGTDVYINNVLMASGLPAGGYFEYIISDADTTTHIRTTKKSYVNHVCGYNNFTSTINSGELGGAVLPPIDQCTGSYEVTVKRSPTSGFHFALNLMVRVDPAREAINSFTYSINNGAEVAIDPTHFTYIMDSAFAFYDRYKAGGSAFFFNVNDGDRLKVRNSVARFHLGTMLGKDNPGNKYGYFSDFAASSAAAGIGGFLQPKKRTYCGVNPVQMVASGGISYKWSATNPAFSYIVDNLDYDTIAAPYFFPDSAGVYDFKVEIGGECNADTTFYIRLKISDNNIASFSFDNDDGCSPFDPIVTNLSDTIGNDLMIWAVYPAYGDEYEINQDTLPRTFQLDLPDNNSDTVQVHSLSLIVQDRSDNACPSFKKKDIKVRPHIEAAFSLSDTIGCHPLPVTFVNEAKGHLDSTSYFWDFGDNTQSFDSLPTKTYTNYTSDNVIYTISFITESPLGCTDTAQQEVTVHPRIKMIVAADTTEACSPLVSTLYPDNSIGVDTLWWNIDYFYGDSTFVDTVKNPINIFHEDTTTAAGPDTLWVQLVGSNRMGCRDTAVTRRLIAYPNVTADFTMSDTIVCDSVPITFTNNSFGYKLFYEWDFGNNTYSQDTTAKSYTKAFTNRYNDESLASDRTYVITLNAESEYHCAATFVDSIIVHPYVKADFGIGYINNCSPVLAELANTSTGSIVNYWDFGSGSYIINNADTINQTFITNNDNINDTIDVKLRVRNAYDCYDSVSRPMIIFPRVVADFDFTTDSIGCAPFNVGLENKSKGGNLIYTWQFGDNTSSTTGDTNLIKTYSNFTHQDTTYYLSLTARNQQGCDSVVTRPVEVFAYVNSSFSLPVSDSCSPFTIRPDNLSSVGAKVFNWDFGNGNTSTDFEPIVPTYIKDDETVGVYDVQLVAAGAADAAHMACADTHIIQIQVFPELEAEFLMSDTISCQPLVSAISNNTNIKTNTSFLWYLDNDFYSSDENPPILNKNNFTPYDDTLTLYMFGRSQYNCRDTAQKQIIVYSLVDAFFSVAPSAICSADSFQIDQTFTQGGITHRTWDFNGEDTANTTTNRFYKGYENQFSTTPLKKYVSLTVFNSHNCSDIWSDTITVYPQVTAEFEPDYYAACYPHATQFVNNSTNATKAHWVFGDGASSLDSEPLHGYKNFSPVDDKSFKVKLTATSDYNCFDTITKNITILAKPKADFFFPIAVDCPPFEVDMINNSLGSNPVYNWNFNNEDSSNVANPSYVFTNSTPDIQDKNISLIITSDKLCSDTLIKTASVYPEVNVNFELTDSAGCSPLEIKFTGDTTNVLQMLWYIDGSAFSTIKDPTHRFVNETPGNKVHDIKFEAYSLYECSADITKQVTVFPTPIAEFIPSPLPANYDTLNDQTTITFNNETVFANSWSYSWDFGDGNSSENNESSFDYTYGYYFWGKKENDSRIPVTMHAWNTDNPECTDSTSHDIIIYAPMPQVDVGEDLTGCQPFTVDLSAITKYIDDDDYEWQFGTAGETSTEPEPTYTFTEPGAYTVKLQVYGDGGTNWDYKIINVNPKPQVDFTFNDSVVFDSSLTKGYDWINFYNHTRFASGDGYAWYFDVENNFGGTPDSEEPNPSWFYTEENEEGYYVGLIAFSNEGCSDSLIHPTRIKVLAQGFVKFPTAFLVSPDGAADENVNEGDRNKYVFYPLSDGVDEYHLEVYNRWGVRVFESKHPLIGWNGYVDGSPAKQDVYVWRARGIYANGQPFDMSGDVTLIHGKDEVSP